ncbi:MAG TPA: polysaccharide biosynthesis/export family protein [Sphingomicrobium sp.]|nr:polysaccharide biosynthesis/export family protein [Sphingomicrobium sp.]
MFRGLIASVSLLALAGCASGSSLAGTDLPTGSAAYTALPPPPAIATGVYRIAPYDTLVVTVFQEPDLSTPANSPLQVDARGNINMPLVGAVPAAGKTTTELSSAIAAGLAQRYLRNPQVSVAIASSQPEKITVQGEVNQAGVFDIRGKTSLLQALSLARGESKLAATNEVAIFRTINGQRMGALFDVDQIRRGAAPDPELAPNDVVIVGHSRRKEAWQNVLAVNPLSGVFRVLTAIP